MVSSPFMKVKVGHSKEDETIRDDFSPQVKTKLLEREQNRLDKFHIVTHIYAGLIIFAFLFAVGFIIISNTDKTIPDYFISIVSMVIAFYFGRYVTSSK